MRKALAGMSSGNIKKLVFLTPYPISNFEKEKWCFDYLRGEGFEIQVLNLTKLLNKRLKFGNVNAVGHPHNQALRDSFVHQVASYRELDCLVRQFSGDALFIDYLVGVSDITLKEERVFRVLKKHRARFTFLLSGALPLPSPLAVSTSGVLKVLQSKVLKAVTSPGKLVNFFAAKVILLLTKHQILYSLPTVVFGGESDVLRSYIKKRNFDATKLVRINSTDYDASVLFLRKAGGELPGCKNICVFLDEAATHHPDFAILGMMPPDSKTYFSNMNRLFDFIEEDMGLDVVIAAHPRSRYESMPAAFGERPVIKDKTVELVASAKLVVAHMSTSISYAVLFRRPTIFAKIPGMGASSHLNLMVETMAAALGAAPIDLEKDDFTTSPLLRQGNLENYAEYEKCYVKTEGAAESPVWEIVAKTVKSMS
jgi:hypothetical protein